MNRQDDQTDEVIDLGAASEETRGVAGPPTDEIGLFKPLGLSDD